MINQVKFKNIFKYLIIIITVVIVLHFIFLRYDYSKFENNQAPVFSIREEYYPPEQDINPSITYAPEYRYYGLGYILTSKHNNIEVDGIPGIELVDKYITSEKHSNVIKADQYEGVILADTELSTWTPDRKVIDDFESGLKDYLDNLDKNNGIKSGITYSNERLTYVQKNLKSYKRQYIGKTVNGEKILFCNFLTTTYEDINNRWRKDYIAVLDGGARFFSIDYNNKTKKYFNLMINGDS